MERIGSKIGSLKKYLDLFHGVKTIRLLIIGTLLMSASLLPAEESQTVTILSFTRDTLPENLRMAQSSDSDNNRRCTTIIDNEQTCLRLEQFGNGYWQIKIKEDVNLKDYSYMKIEARAEPKAEMKIHLMTTAGKGYESFTGSFDITGEWKTYYIPLTQNDEGRGGFKFNRSFGNSDNETLRAGRLTAIWLTPWAAVKRIFYVRSISLTSEDGAEQSPRKIK